MKRRLEALNWRLLITIVLLIVSGYIIFLSASVGLVARSTGASFGGIVFRQTVFGLIPGIAAMIYLSRRSYKRIRPLAFYLLVIGIAANLLVFIPGLGFEHAGARRWISLFGLTLQPSELLKIASIIYCAAWFAVAAGRQKVNTAKWGLLPFLVIMSVSGVVLVLEPDIDTLLVLFVSCLSIYVVAGAKMKHVFVVFVLGLALLTTLALVFPYVSARIKTYINPSADSLDSGYQIQQALIAIGSGGVFGRGFGKSVQKFGYLPEPIGDSVFAVASEEFGLIGSCGLLTLFFLLLHFGLRVSSRAPDFFGKYLALGIVVMFITQAMVNIGAMLGILPLSGITLPFVSQGGTALFFTLAETGILLSISRTANS